MRRLIQELWVKPKYFSLLVTYSKCIGTRVPHVSLTLYIIMINWHGNYWPGVVYS